MRADADDEEREHDESSSLLPAHVALLLDELGHGQLVRKLEEDNSPVRSSEHWRSVRGCGKSHNRRNMAEQPAADE